ncbi:MAG: A/G-specific adenine glycosylase [Planctomycetes bacterium]|nr:A/G-specific adenine glycosylase [Planctomycetota bacterium]
MTVARAHHPAAAESRAACATEVQRRGSASEWVRELQAWFRSARRDLPWRRRRDPYAVWISETMLQQTRVEVVVPYFERFLARYPTVADLAAAPVEDVLAAWSGLGYYRRARALHAAARTVVQRHAGELPASRAALLALPGVGPYTAGAVASIAFDAPEPLVDGNVARVLARIFALEAAPESAEFRAATWRIAGELVTALEGSSPGAWNQALMELGALVCVPRAPRCPECPVRACCRAAADGLTDSLPVPKRRPAAIGVELHVALARDGERLVVAERPERGRMAGLLELPTCEPSGGRLLHAPEWPRAEGGWISAGEELGSVSHAITKHRIRARVFAARWNGAPPTAPLRLLSAAEAAQRGLTGLAAKVLRARFAR